MVITMKKLNIEVSKKEVASKISDAAGAASWCLLGADIAFKLAKNTAFRKQLNILSAVVCTLSVTTSVYLVLKEADEKIININSSIGA